MVIPTGGEKQRTGVTPHGLIEAKSPVVEALGRFEVTDMQMDVSHRRTGRRSVPRLPPAGREEILDVERVGRHREFAAAVAPGAARPIDVYLDAEAIGIGEIQRFADEMVGHPDARTDLREMADKPAEAGALRKENGKMIQAEHAAAARRLQARASVEPHEWPIAASGAEAGAVRLARLHAKPEDLLVVVERALEIRDL
jgi:hypothetical protein